MALVELHAHSYFSFLDALASPEGLLGRAKDLGYTALALTDHGGLFGIPKFLRAAAAAGIKPIIGCELYVSPTVRTDRSPDLRPVGHHLTLLAENVEGYKSLARLSSIGYEEGFFYRPRVDRDALAAHAKGLILLTGCIHSALSDCLMKQNAKAADELIGFYIETFGRDRVFVEIQRHGLDEEEPLLDKLSGLAQKHRLRRVATNDVHYLQSQDAEPHQIAMDLRSRKLPTDPRRSRFLKPSYGLLSHDQWIHAFGKGFEDVFETASEISDRCNVKADDIRHHLGAPDKTAYLRLQELVQRSAIQRGGASSGEMMSRLTVELEAIQSAGLVEYFLMIHNLVSEAKSQGIMVGPGRGSASGSLLAYLLDITEINPLDYQLSFERFLSPSRKTLPDVDVDVDFRQRAQIIEIFRKLDSDAKTFRAGTISSMGLKSAIREIARSRGLPYREVDDKINSLPAGASVLEPDDRPAWKELTPMINILAPLPRMSLGHPTAVMAVPRTLEPFLPAYRSPEGHSWLQYDSEDLDWMGIPRLDILPLKILSVITETIQWLKIGGVADIDLKMISLNDRATFDLLARGDTVGIFQLESPGMRHLLKELAPTSIQDLAIALALYRPGPLEADVPRIYVERRNGRMESTPLHPMFESVLRDTHGLVLYQEQVLTCARLAGLSDQQADGFRIAVSKKNLQAMKEACGVFEKALQSAGLGKKESAALVEQISHYAGFSFNKAHAISYSILTYRAAYLKAHHPAAYLSSLANVHLDERHQLGEIFSEARRLGIKIDLPDIRIAGSECVPEPGGKRIRLGMRLIRHLPDTIVPEILKQRPFSDIPELLIKVPALAAHQSLEMLCKAGALDGFGSSRVEILRSLPYWLERVKLSSKGGGFQTDLFEELGKPSESSNHPDSVAEDLEGQNELLLEYEALGFFGTGSPMDELKEIVTEFSSGRISELLARTSGGQVQPGRERMAGHSVTLAGLLMALRPHLDRNGREMAFAKLEDDTSSLDIVFFHDTFIKYKSVLSLGKPFLISGRLEKRGISATLLADLVVEADKPERLYDSILLKLDEGIGIDAMKRIKEVLKDHLGDRPVYVEMTEAGNTFGFRVGWSCRPSTELRRKLESILGPYSVFFLKTTDSPVRR